MSSFLSTDIVQKTLPKVSAIGIFYLVISLVSGATIVPFSVSLPLESTFLKLFWRLAATIPFLIMCSAFQIYKLSGFKFRDIMTYENMKQLLVLTFYMNYMQVCYILSGEYTIMTHCCILINLSGILIVMQRIIYKQRVHKLEIIGTVIALTGCVVTIFDDGAEKVDPTH
jgi:hypothetical protein